MPPFLPWGHLRWRPAPGAAVGWPCRAWLVATRCLAAQLPTVQRLADLPLDWLLSKAEPPGLLPREPFDNTACGAFSLFLDVAPADPWSTLPEHGGAKIVWAP